MAKPIVVVGSVNMDLVTRVGRMPAAGETILSQSDLVMIPGGKGANQAVAAARLARGGTEVYVVGRVGVDAFGERLAAGLTAMGVRIDFLTPTANSASGTATILVDETGENAIVVSAGANGKLSPSDVDKAEELIAGAAAVVVQLEVPVRTVGRALEIAKKHGVFTVLDPAPVPEGGKLPRALYAVDVLTPNQVESEMLLGIEPRGARGRQGKKVWDPKVVGADLISRGARNVVLKMGEKGAVAVTAEGKFVTVPAYPVKVVDTTAAGDAFTAGIAVGQGEGMALGEATRFAAAAGALTCTGFGAQPSLPTREAVGKLMARRR